MRVAGPVLVCLMLLVPAVISAHVVRFPRVVHVLVEPERIAVAVGVKRHAGPSAQRIRARFDLDGDGALNDLERGDLARWLDAKARPNLRLTLDDVPVRMEQTESQLDLLGVPTTFEGDGLTFRSVTETNVVLRPGVHTLVIADAPENEGDLVPWRIDLPEGWTITAAEATELATPPVRAGERSWQAAFSGTGGEVTITIEVPGRVGSAEP